LAENLAMKQLLDFHSIRKVIYRYSRALDRCDLDLLKGVYWPDATLEHGSFNGNAHEFADDAVPAVRKKFLRTLHSIANIHVDVQGDFADSESYVTAYHMIRAIRRLSDRFLEKNIWTGTRILVLRPMISFISVGISIGSSVGSENGASSAAC
jgi:hypothetical protein